MKRKMLTAFCLGLLVLTQTAHASEKITEEISATKNGLLKIGVVEIGMRYFSPGFASHSKQGTDFSPTEATTPKDGKWQWSGKFVKSFQMTETLTKLADKEIRCDYKLISEKGVPTQILYADMTLPLANFVGRNIEIDGKPIMLPKEYGQLFLFQGKSKRTVIRGNKGTVTLSSDGLTTQVQDNRKFGTSTVSIRLYVNGLAKVVKDASVGFTLKVDPYNVKMLDLRSAVNLAFKDEKAGDCKGGWSDQGPENDLRMLKTGKRNFGPVKFEIINANQNNGKACIVLEGPKKKMLPTEATVAADGKAYKYIYLLHSTAWTPSGKVQFGDIVAKYVEGEEKIIPVTTGVDCANWWMPSSLENGAVVWTAENKRSYVGLYLSRFELDDKPLQSLTFKSNKSAFWMIPAVSLSNERIFLPQAAGTFYVVENTDWKPFSHKFGIEPGSILDFSHFGTPVIGKDSWIINKDGQFVARDNPEEALKLIGPNFCMTANTMIKENVDKTVDSFVRMGYNTVRFHHFDGYILKGGRHKAKVSDDIDPAALDRLDYTLYKLKEAGMYVTIDLYCNRIFTKGEIAGWDKPHEQGDFKALIPIYPAAYEAWKKFVVKFMNHVNPYTGLAWKDDPAVFSICPINEDTVQWRVNKNPEIKAMYTARFEEWLAKNNFEEKAKDEMARETLFNVFLNDIKTESNLRIEKFLRELGVKAMLTSCNAWSNKEMAFERDELDYVDNHSYWEHPQFLGERWRLPTSYAQRSATKSFAGNTRRLTGSRVFGKPFAVTEFQYCSPNKYRAEGGALFGAYSALQDWGALYRFTWSHSEKGAVGLRPVGGFDLANDPLSQLSERLIILMFRRGDVKPAQKKIIYGVTREDACSLESGNKFTDLPYIGLVSQVGSIALPKGRTLPNTFDTVISDIPLDKEQYGENKFLLGPVAREKYIPDESCIKSDTGEIEIMGDKGILKVVTPKTECFVAPENNELSGNCLKAKIGATFATVAASAIDDAPLADSKRVLILHLTDIKNTKMKFRTERMSILEKYGSLPHLVKRGTAQIRIRNSNPNMAVWAVAINGSQLEKVESTYENGEYVFTAETCPENGKTRMAYELSAE